MFLIGVTARPTGMEIGSLRKREAHHGFPQPEHKESGQPIYNESDVTTPLQVYRRLSNGERVGSLIHVRSTCNDPSLFGEKARRPRRER